MTLSDKDILELEKKLLEKQDSLEEKEKALQELKDKTSALREEYQEKLERASGLTKDEAKEKLLEELEKSEAAYLAKFLREREDDAKAKASKKAQEILIDSMRHGALDYIAEYTVSTVRVPEEDMKGRIIGKEGRNIRAFEQATGVDIDLDEEGVIRLSSFDQIRREVARRALEKLLKDTRIQPFRIEEVVKQTKEEVEKVMLEEGEKLAQAAGVYNLPVGLLSILGRFKFRTSFGQNLIVHTLEETKIGVHIAQEIGGRCRYCSSWVFIS